MKSIKTHTIIAVIFMISSVSVAQNLSLNNLKEGEIYYMDWEHTYQYQTLTLVSGNAKSKPSYSTTTDRGKQIFIYKNGQIENTLGYSSSDNVSYSSGSKSTDNYRDYKINTLREATKEEKHWLEICIEENKSLTKEEALKRTKNRGKIKVAQLSLNPADRNSPKFKGNKNGFCFSPVYFNYQFVNCGGEVQMGVNIYTNPQADYQKHTTSNGYLLDGEHYVSVVSSTNKVDIQEVEADLYYGSQRLGKVNLNYIVGNFTGCFGETFQILKDVGKDPTLKEYRENLDKFEMKNIRILRGDLKISDREREEIHKSLKYDAFGNSLNPDTKPAQNAKKKYDAFGNEIKSNNTGTSQKKYDAFGNPIKN